jgi:hypothetical protein
LKNLVLLLIPLMLVVGGISIWKGRGAERMGGTALIASLFIQFGALAVAKASGASVKDVVQVLDLVLSFYLAGTFLIASLKFGSAWLGVACLIQALEMAITAVFDSQQLAAYLNLLNLMTLLIVIVLAIATAISIVRRRRGPFSEYEMRGTRLVAFSGLAGIVASLWPQAGDWPWGIGARNTSGKPKGERPDKKKKPKP